MPGRIFEAEDETTIRPEPGQSTGRSRNWRAGLIALIAIAIIAIAGVGFWLVRHPIEIDISRLPTIPQEGIAGIISAIAVVIFVLLGIAIYAIPTIVAAIRRHRNLAAIFVINLFLGWTLLGWVGALVWAVIVTREDSNYSR